MISIDRKCGTCYNRVREQKYAGQFESDDFMKSAGQNDWKWRQEYERMY